MPSSTYLLSLPKFSHSWILQPLSVASKLISLLQRPFRSLKSPLHCKSHNVTPIASLLAYKLSGALHSPQNRAQILLWPRPNMELCDPAPATMLPPRPSSLPRHTVTFLCFAVHGLHLVLWFKLLPFLDCFPLIFRDPVLPILKEPQLLQKTFPFPFSRGAFLHPLHAPSNLFVSP